MPKLGRERTSGDWKKNGALSRLLLRNLYNLRAPLILWRKNYALVILVGFHGNQGKLAHAMYATPLSVLD
jgi:hypothetical protein